MCPKTKTSGLSAIPWRKHKLARQTMAVPWNKPANDQPVKTSLTTRPTTPQQIGAANEARARDYLVAQGLQPIAQNFRCKCGELDLIMAQGNCAVIVEVRTRNNPRFGSAIESIDAAKQNRVSRCAKLWWMQQGQRHYRTLRFDVVAIQTGSKFLWIQNAWQLPA